MHHWMQWLIYCNTPVRWLACPMTGSTSVPLRTTVYTGSMNFTNGSPSGRKHQKRKRNQFLSSKLHFDLESMCLGFQSMVHYKLLKVQNAVIKPAVVNQYCVENHFCQVRSCNGQNDNPAFHQQQSTQNSIRPLSALKAMHHAVVLLMTQGFQEQVIIEINLCFQ